MTQETEQHEEHGEHERKTEVEVTASYLPSSDRYDEDLPRPTALGTVLTKVKSFFKVEDFKDRDTHTFHLMFEGQQRDDLGTTLEQLLKPNQRNAHFQLIEKIQAG